MNAALADPKEEARSKQLIQETLEYQLGGGEPSRGTHVKVVDEQKEQPVHKISKMDHIVFKDRNIFVAPDVPTTEEEKAICLNIDNMKVLIKDDSKSKVQPDAMLKQEPKDPFANVKENPTGGANGKVINYETFESSSEDEFSCGAFESAAQSFQNKEKNGE